MPADGGMDHRRMFFWAKSQLQNWMTEQAQFFAMDEREIGCAIDWATGDVTWHMAKAPGLNIPPDWVFRIGDIVHNLRVSLDYLAFELVETRNPAIAEDRELRKKPYFPIVEYFRDPLPGEPDHPRVTCEGKWSEHVARLDRFMPDGALDVIKSVQPFMDPWPAGVVYNANYHPLLLLAQMDNPHKHRQLLGAMPSFFSRWTPESFTQYMAGHGLQGPYRDDVVFAKSKLPVATDEDRERAAEALHGVTWACTFAVLFADGQPAAHMRVDDVLRHIAWYIETVVFKRLSPWLSD